MNDKQKLKEFIHHWATKYHYFDADGTLKDNVLYDVGYDLKPAIEDSPFNDAPEDGYDFWYDLFLEEDIVPILIEYGALTED